MDTIAFVDTGVAETGVRIIVNGRELIEIVREVELVFAAREGHPDLAGAYSYFGPMCVFLPARHFLGEPMHDWSDAFTSCHAPVAYRIVGRYQCVSRCERKR